MANKCAPKPASFDCFLITNNSRWESEIRTYEKARWSCLSRLPKSLLLKQMCTFRSPGRDTRSGWTRTLPPAPAGIIVWRSRGEVAGYVPAGGSRRPLSLGLCPAAAGAGIETLPVFSSTCPGQLHLSVPPRGCRAREGRTEPPTDISLTNRFSRGAHRLPERQISEQGVVLCDGAGDPARVRFLSPLR